MVDWRLGWFTGATRQHQERQGNDDCLVAWRTRDTAGDLWRAGKARASKRQHPMTGGNVGFLGCYFNDQGINPMHDEFFAPMSEEAAAILKAARDEAPDMTVSLHGHSDLPTLIPPAYVPREIVEDVQSLARTCYKALADRTLPRVGLFEIEEECGKSSSCLQPAQRPLSHQRHRCFHF